MKTLKQNEYTVDMMRKIKKYVNHVLDCNENEIVGLQRNQ